MTQQWIIVEDALRSRKGHWLQYIESFRRGLSSLNIEATVLVDRRAEQYIKQIEGVHAVLPDSIWERMGDGASRLVRYYRVPAHAFNTYWTVRNWFRTHALPVVIFVPTVLVHYLLGWCFLFDSVVKSSNCRLLLFFPNSPLTYDKAAERGVLGTDPSAKLFRWLIQRMKAAVESGQLILGVETESMRDALSNATEVPFTYLPHPVELPYADSQKPPRPGRLRFGCYGSARYEKGSDLLQQAIQVHLNRRPETDSLFYIQWIEPFADAAGRILSVDETLAQDPRVHFVRDYFRDGQNEVQLQNTDAHNSDAAFKSQRAAGPK